MITETIEQLKAEIADLNEQLKEQSKEGKRVTHIYNALENAEIKLQILTDSESKAAKAFEIIKKFLESEMPQFGFENFYLENATRINGELHLTFFRLKKPITFVLRFDSVYFIVSDPYNYSKIPHLLKSKNYQTICLIIKNFIL